MHNSSTQRRFNLHLSLIILYLIAGYIIELSSERQSLLLLDLPVITDHWLPLYPFYLLCRTQALLFYLLWRIIPYTLGILTLSMMWYRMMVILFKIIGPWIVYPVLYEYLGLVKQIGTIDVKKS